MFSINYRDPRPIYEQVKDNLKRSIITGILKPEDKIPSVRDAAGELAINPNTIQKAYRELENEGYIYSVVGKGSFVAECDNAIENLKIDLFRQLDKTVRDLKHLHVSVTEICEHISEGGSEEENND